MMKVALVVLSLALICSAQKTKKKKRCYAPSYGTITRHKDGMISYDCDQGFELLGPRETVCDKKSRKKNRAAVCSPVFYGPVNCTTLDVCPSNLNYLTKYEVGEVDMQTVQEAKNLTDTYFAATISRTADARRVMCQQACKFGIGVCQFYKTKKNGKRMFKMCFGCFKRGCSFNFWG